MTPNLIFSFGNQLAIIGWLALILCGRIRFVSTVLCKFIIPGLIAAVYAVIIATQWAGHQGGFNSVAAVQRLFGNPWLLTPGWLHYLSSDLFVGAWQVRDAQRHEIAHWWVIPCLVMTFLFGPVGFLLYLGVKIWRSRKPAAI